MSNTAYNTWMQAVDRRHADAKEQVERFLDPADSRGKDMYRLVQWMLETDSDPYGYLQHTWAESIKTATGFASLLAHISHAIHDDGDICFVTVNSEPKIVFSHPSYPDFEQYVVWPDLQKSVYKYQGMPEIALLDIRPNEFGDVYDRYEASRLARLFRIDTRAALRSGTPIAQVIAQYETYRLWDPKLAEDALADRLRGEKW